MAITTIERSWRQQVADHLAVTKPRIIILIVLTTWASMWLAAPQRPELLKVAFTLLGTALAVGAAHTFNQYLERDIDALMQRTQHRPLVTGRMSPGHALRYGFTLAIASFALMVWQVNLPAALLAQSGLLYYVLVYTVLLKRRTPLNTVIGGVSGAIPPLIGWAAATGRLEAPALALFILMVLWQPPHFFGLTLYRLEDYRQAQVPMLPVVSGPRATLRQIALYTTAMVLVSLTLYYPLQLAGPLYLAVAAASGAYYIWLAWSSLYQEKESVEARGKRLFFYSMLYLALVFVAMVLDVQR